MLAHKENKSEFHILSLSLSAFLQYIDGTT